MPSYLLHVDLRNSISQGLALLLGGTMTTWPRRDEYRGGDHPPMLCSSLICCLPCTILSMHHHLALHVLIQLQVIWESSTELGCGSADCTVASRSGTFFRTYVVCRYRPAGNVLSQYLDNVNHVVSTDEATCTDIVAAHGDPHMVGFQHQKFDFTGEDGQWYALIHDSAMDLDMNMRITQPMSEVPQVTYITGIGLSVLGADDEVHTFEIVIGDPHSLSPECSERDGRPCLADGALTILVDGKEAGVGEVCSKRCVRSGCPKGRE